MSQLTVFPLNLGGNVFGWTADRDATYAILDAFVAGGGNFVDTADAYSAWVPGHTGGESETLIGQWLAARGSRDDVVIATKVSRHPELRGLAPATIRAGADASLRRLGTDRIDLYYAHYDDPEVPVAEFAGAFSELVDAGKVRHLGISNMEPDRIDEWFAVAAADGLHAPIALQPMYSLVERGFETNGLLDVAQRHDLDVLPYYALASGFLSGKYRAGETPQGARAGGVSRYLDDRGAEILRALAEVADAHRASMASTALAWLRLRPTVLAPIASASRVEQVPDLIASATLELTAEEIASLDQASA